MKLSIKDIGKIKEAEIDLDKNLSVFFGKNNTGKTFVSYCIFAAYNQNFEYFNKKELLDVLFNGVDFSKLFVEDSLAIDLENLFVKNFSIIKEKIEGNLKSTLDSVFGIYNNSFVNSSIFLSHLSNQYTFAEYLNKEPEITFGFYGSIGRYRFNLNGSKIKIVIEEKPILPNSPEQGNQEADIRQIQEIIASFKINQSKNCIFIPAERIGISVFGRDVILNRFNKPVNPNKNPDLNTYSSVIIDALTREFRSRPVLRKTEQINIRKLSDVIEKEILNGNLRVDDKGSVFFDDVNVKDVSIMSAASTIKSLSALVFYLRYYAFEGQVLIIDEPEVNLHPENQVKIARLLARISNLGIKVIVSTHSDYIIREFNNLIMLGSSKKEKSELLEEFGYEKDELLFNDNIGAYLFENGYAKSIEVGEDGFQVDSIDEVIVKQNNAANKIRWELFEEE
jgi:hypothetical protein